MHEWHDLAPACMNIRNQSNNIKRYTYWTLRVYEALQQPEAAIRCEGSLMLCVHPCSCKQVLVGRKEAVTHLNLLLCTVFLVLWQLHEPFRWPLQPIVPLLRTPVCTGILSSFSSIEKYRLEMNKTSHDHIGVFACAFITCSFGSMADNAPA